MNFDEIEPHATACFEVSVTFPIKYISSYFHDIVDLASVDRRNHDREQETSARLNVLVDNFTRSDIHNETLQKVMEETMKPSTQNTMVFFYKPRPPNIFRVMWALMRFVDTMLHCLNVVMNCFMHFSTFNE